jgi:hypothetical protein
MGYPFSPLNLHVARQKVLQRRSSEKFLKNESGKDTVPLSARQAISLKGIAIYGNTAISGQKLADIPAIVKKPIPWRHDLMSHEKRPYYFEYGLKLVVLTGKVSGTR